MFTISDDSTEAWTRYLFAGSSGWSILKSFTPAKMAPVTSMSPMNNPAHPAPELKVASPGVATIPSPVVRLGENPPTKLPPVPALYARACRLVASGCEDSRAHFSAASSIDTVPSGRAGIEDRQQSTQCWQRAARWQPDRHSGRSIGMVRFCWRKLNFRLRGEFGGKD